MQRHVVSPCKGLAVPSPFHTGSDFLFTPAAEEIRWLLTGHDALALFQDEVVEGADGEHLGVPVM